MKFCNDHPDTFKYPHNRENLHWDVFVQQHGRLLSKETESILNQFLKSCSTNRMSSFPEFAMKSDQCECSFNNAIMESDEGENHVSDWDDRIMEYTLTA